MAPETGLREGQAFGNYQIDRLFDRHALGTLQVSLYLGRGRQDPTLAIAIKVLQPDPMQLPQDLVRQAFADLVGQVKQLQHAHIVMVLGSGEYDGTFYLVTPYIAGRSLLEIAAAGPMPLDRVESLGRQVAEALAYAHAHDVIHGDLTPPQVLIDQQDNAYISDFGFRTFYERIAGSPVLAVPPDPTGFLAPERVYRQPVVGRVDPLTTAADQYSLGAVYYLLATGIPPAHAHRGNLLAPPHVLRADIPEAASSAIMRALSPSPGDRFPSVTAFAQVMADTLSQLTSRQRAVSAQPTRYIDSPARAGRPRRGRGGVLVGATVAAALVIGGAGVWLHAPGGTSTVKSTTIASVTTVAGTPRATATAVPGLPAPPAGFGQYVSPDGVFGLNIPRTWQKSTRPYGGAPAVVFAAPAGEASLLIVPIATPLDPSQYATVLTQTLQGVHGATAVQVNAATSDVSYGTTRWTQVSGTFAYQNHPQQALALFTAHAGLTYMVLFVASPDNLVGIETGAFEPMMQSLTFLK